MTGLSQGGFELNAECILRPAPSAAALRDTFEHRKSRKLWERCGLMLVPGAGLEPARLAAGDFE